MVTLTINPTVVTLSFSQDLTATQGQFVVATDQNGQVLAEFYPAFLTPCGQGPFLLMKDTRTGTTYKSKTIDRDNPPDLNQLLEAMLNKINLTHIERTLGVTRD